MCKKLIYLICFVVALSLAGDVRADVVNWTDASGDHDWFTAANWDAVLSSVDTAKVNIPPGPTIADEGAVAGTVLIGLSGGLTVDGGSLTTASGGLTVGRPKNKINESVLNMISGTITVNAGLIVGHEGWGTMNMSGGSITTSGFKIGYKASGRGHVNLDGGTITSNNFNMRYLSGSMGTMNVTGGTLIINDDKLSLVQKYIDKGWITAYGGDDTLQLDYDVTNEGKTTLTAPGLFPIPADGSTVSVSLNQLQWTLPETGPFGGVVACSVFFGTNPSVWENPKIVSRQVVESVSVTLTADTMYYWVISLGDSESPTPDVPFLWAAFTFTAVDNFPPTVNAGDDVTTWLANGESERVVQLDGSASDDGQIEALSYEWTVITEPNELNPATFDDATLPNATVTVRVPGSYTLGLEAYDGEYTVTNTMQIVLYADSCEHASNQEGFEWLTGDLNRDCKVDFVDFANLAASWLQENDSTE